MALPFRWAMARELVKLYFTPSEPPQATESEDIRLKRLLDAFLTTHVHLFEVTAEVINDQIALVVSIDPTHEKKGVDEAWDLIHFIGQETAMRTGLKIREGETVPDVQRFWYQPSSWRPKERRRRKRQWVTLSTGFAESERST